MRRPAQGGTGSPFGPPGWFCARSGSGALRGVPSCQRVLAGQHPDLIALRLIEESQQIRIEQVRELCEELSLTSHQGGYKVGVISPADTLNRFAANALLKTLEEPPPRTLLVLVATQPSRLPATILSRCQRIGLRAPAREEAVAWLQATQGAGDWDAVLDMLGEAPMLAAGVDPKAVVQTGQETGRLWRRPSRVRRPRGHRGEVGAVRAPAALAVL